MQKNMRSTYASPLSKGYFHSATREFADIRSISLAAVLCAMAVVLKLFDLQLLEVMRISLTFVPIALCSALTGPVMALPCGIIVDIVGYVVHPTGAYLPGYTLSAILTAVIFSLFLYKAKMSFLRIALSKLFVNIFVNVFLGSVWRIFISGNFYAYYVCIAAVKNAFMLPIEVAILCLLFTSLAKPLEKMGFVGFYNTKITKKQIILLAAVSVISAASVILFTLYYNGIVQSLKSALPCP